MHTTSKKDKPNPEYHILGATRIELPVSALELGMIPTLGWTRLLAMHSQHIVFSTNQS